MKVSHNDYWDYTNYTYWGGGEKMVTLPLGKYFMGDLTFVADIPELT